MAATTVISKAAKKAQTIRAGRITPRSASDVEMVDGSSAVGNFWGLDNKGSLSFTLEPISTFRTLPASGIAVNF